MRIISAGLGVISHSCTTNCHIPLAESLNQIGGHIINVNIDLLQKLNRMNKSPQEFLLETVQLFFRKAQTAGSRLRLEELAFLL